MIRVGRAGNGPDTVLSGASYLVASAQRAALSCREEAKEDTNMTTTTRGGIVMTVLAAEAIDEVGMSAQDISEDLAQVASGDAEGVFRSCLDGVSVDDASRRAAWSDYLDALVGAAPTPEVHS